MKHLLLILMGIIAVSAHGQYYTTGDDPRNIDWRQINQQRYRIIFDKEMEPWAARLSFKMDSIIDKDVYSLGYFPKKIDLLMHSRTTISNGMVAWAPSRLEMYTFADVDGDCVPWMTHLAIHEYRHVVQTSMLKRGFSRFLYGLFGEQAIGAVLGVYIPLWLMEGDAVANETSLTQGGRGRQAQFEQEMRALTLNGLTPKYDQAYNGSYKRRVPNYYHMGYLTVSNVRRRYGSEVWKNAYENVGQKSWSFTPFNRSLKRDTGHDKVELYDEAMSDWKEMWQKQDSSVVATPYKTVLSTQDDYSDYTSAQMTDRGLVAYKIDPDELTKIVDQEGNSICIPSAVSDYTLSTKGDTIVWCERRQHPRWGNGGENAIMMIKTDGKGKKTIAKGYLSSPSISADGRSIAAVETKRDGRQQIVVLDFDGKREKEYQLQEWEQATSLCWMDGNIVYIMLSDKGKSIKSIDKDGNQKTIKPASYTNIRHLASDDKTLYYTSDATGIENIYSLSLDGEEIRITSSRTGAAWPMVNKGTLYYSEYSHKGYSIAETSTTTRATDSPISPMRDVADMLSEKDASTNKTDIDKTPIEAKKYRRISHLFRLHSWGPIVVDAENNVTSAGIAIASQNTLGTSTLSAGINWSNDTDERYFARYSYTGLFPKIGIYGTWGYYDYKFDGIKTISDEQDGHHSKYEGMRYTYDDRQKTQHYAISTSAPLTTVRGAWIIGACPKASINYYKYSPIEVQKQKIVVENNRQQISETETYEADMNEYGCVGYGISMSLLRRMATRDVGYRWGVSSEIGYRHCPIEQDNGDLRYGSVTMFLPGIGQHHNISVQAQWQDKGFGETRMSITDFEYKLLLGDVTGIARGTKRERNKNIALLRLNYTMPIVDPDASFGSLCYIKRIVGRAFYDRERIELAPFTFENETTAKHYNCVGIETWMESHWLRLPYMVKLGYRGTAVNGNKFCSEMIFGLNIK